MTALLQGDTDGGYLLMHQAVEEDKRATRQPAPDRPSFALVSLNHGKVDQLFRSWVIEQARFLDSFIKNYADTHNQSFSMAEVERRFLTAPPNIETVFLLTYTVARLKKMSDLPEYATSNQFAGQLHINLLFDIALVIEVAIKAKMKKDATFIDCTEYLLDKAGHKLKNNQLGKVNAQFLTDFDKTLRAALDGTLVWQPNTPCLDRLKCDAALALGLRNRAAHNVESAPIVLSRFHDIRQALRRVFCAAVDYLY